MQEPRTDNSPRPAKRWTRRTHRACGLAAVAFLFLITLSGLVLNHADDLGLADRSAASSLVLWLYDIDVPGIEEVFESGDHWFASAASVLYADGDELASQVAPLAGAVTTGGEILLATANELLLLDRQGTLIERAGAQAAGTIGRVGLAGEVFVVLAGGQTFTVNTAMMQLMPANDIGAVQWAQARTPTARQQKRIRTSAVGRTLSWSRLLNDIHSGRILPVAGKYISDLAALCLLYLCGTGLVLALRKR